MAEKTLQSMAAGGVYDHVGGGFHRYSVDEHWHVPHFEKVFPFTRLACNLLRPQSQDSWTIRMHIAVPQSPTAQDSMKARLWYGMISVLEALYLPCIASALMVALPPRLHRLSCAF